MRVTCLYCHIRLMMYRYYKWNADSIHKWCFYFTILLIGWVIRVLYFIQYPVQSRDAYFYLKTINRLSLLGYEELGYIGNHTPPLMLEIAKIPTRIAGVDLIKGAIAMNIAIGVLTIYILLRISEEMHAKKMTSLAIGLLAATNWSMVDYSAKVQREPLFLFLCSLCLLYITKNWKSEKTGYIIAISTTATAATLTRYEGLEIVFIALTTIVVKQIKNIGRMMFLLAVFLLTILLTVFQVILYFGLDQSYIGEIGGFVVLSFKRLIY